MNWMKSASCFFHYPAVCLHDWLNSGRCPGVVCVRVSCCSVFWARLVCLANCPKPRHIPISIPSQDGEERATLPCLRKEGLREREARQQQSLEDLAVAAPSDCVYVRPPNVPVLKQAAWIWMQRSGLQSQWMHNQEMLLCECVQNERSNKTHSFWPL